MGRIVAIGGGDLVSTEKLNRYAIENTETEIEKTEAGIEKTAVDFSTKSFTEGRKIPSRDYGNSWDPKNYSMNPSYGSHSTYTMYTKLEEIPDGVRTAVMANILSGLGILLPFFIFFMDFTGYDKKIQKESSKTLSVYDCCQKTGCGRNGVIYYLCTF